MRKEKKKTIISKRNILLSLVALILVMLTVVSATYSWIEEVSNVEIKTGEGQETPLHIGDKERKSDVKIDTNYTIGDTSYQRQNITYSSIDLGSYFYESGDMHLSGCYSDGDNFYFPVNKKSGKTDSNLNFRQGTKDDANVNYLSVTFNVSSPSSDTVYWFNNDNFLKAYTVNGDTTSENNGAKSLLRCSITVDNNTNVYSASSNGKYKKVSSTSGSAVSTQGRKISAYKWNASGTASGSATNKDADGKVNGNTLFTVEKGATKTVTFKLWLEYSSSYTSISLSQLDLRLDSSWAHTRKITVRNACIYNTADSNWITGNSATVYLMRQDTSSADWNTNEYTYTASDSLYLNQNHWTYSGFSKLSSKVDGNVAYSATVEVPAAYSNLPVYFFRSNNPTSSGSGRDQIDSTGIYSWNTWTTRLPDTYQDETYTIYTPSFGTWGSEARHVGFVNKWNWSTPYAYFWDNSTVMTDGSNTKVIENHSWDYNHNPECHGEKMYKVDGLQAGDHDVYVVYWDASTTTYTHVIFNNNAYNANNPLISQQTSDLIIYNSTLNVDNRSKYYDITSGQWYSNLSNVPDYGMSYYLYGKFNDDSNWDTNIQFVAVDGSAFELYAAVMLKKGTYEFLIKNTYGGTKYYTNENATGDNTPTYTKANTSYFDRNSIVNWTFKEKDSTYKNNTKIKVDKAGIYIFRYKYDAMQLAVQYPYTVNGNTDDTRNTG